MTIRVVIADDHPVFLEGLRMLLETTEGIDVVGEAHNGVQLVELAASTDFDVALVDLDMPELDGSAATEQILSRKPGALVLILTMHDDDSSLLRSLRAGARGYVLKGSAHGSIARAIMAVFDGDTFLSGSAGRTVLEAAIRAEPERLEGVTPRETEVLGLVAKGFSNPEIARELHVSMKTVQNYVSTLLVKMQSRSRPHLVVQARELGFGK